MTTSDFNLVVRETRNNQHDKRKRRHVDQTLMRKEKIAFKAKIHNVIDEDDDGDNN